MATLTTSSPRLAAALISVAILALSSCSSSPSGSSAPHVSSSDSPSGLSTVNSVSTETSAGEQQIERPSDRELRALRGTWQPVERNGKQLGRERNERARITFRAPSEFGGSDGCNSMAMEVAWDGDHLDVVESRSTAMDCRGRVDHIALFSEASNLRVVDDTITLSRGGDVIARYRRV